MNKKEFRQQAVEITLKCLDKQPNEWITFNDNLNTKLLLNTYYSEKITLIDDELPIMECELENSYVLITTDRIISIIDDSEIIYFLDQIENLINDYEGENFKKKDDCYPKIHTIALKTFNDRKLIFKIDSHYPSWFAKILISNLISYKRLGKWFLNPTLKYSSQGKSKYR